VGSAAAEGIVSAIARSLLRELNDFKFVYMLHFLPDYLVILKNFSPLFQRNNFS
jgi:hypothetical protein